MNNKTLIFIIIMILLVAGILYSELRKPSSPIATRADIPINEEQTKIPDIAIKKSSYERAKEIVSPKGYINTDEITVSELIGKKVILIDMWTYSCINCQRTLPYLNAWYEKYKDKGLEIIGVHTPEFTFEKNIENVLDAVKRYGIKYPVVLDNDYGTWNAYSNIYWPRKYLIDIDGFIVYDHAGEGEYERTEKIIQTLIKERSLRLETDDKVATDMVSPQDVETPTRGISPEIYFGYSRNNALENGLPFKGGHQTLNKPNIIKPNKLYLEGEWDFDSEFAKNKSPQSKIIFKYKAQKVFMVARSQEPVRAQLLVDGNPLGTLTGEDVETINGESFVTFNKDRLYRLIDDKDGLGEHTLEIIIESPSLEAYTFTFG